MLIRKANIRDSNDVLDWRNDLHSRQMFYNVSEVPAKVHDSWFENCLSSNLIELYIGECEGKKIGVCRFDLIDGGDFAEVSVNLNPLERGKKMSLSLLEGAIKKYLKSNDIDLIARIKTENSASRRIFEDAGFFKKLHKDNQFTYVLPRKLLRFERVDASHTQILYDLLEQRTHNISHEGMPSFQTHQDFIKSHPYLHWFVVFDEYAVGAFYIQSDNSVGLNLLSVRGEWISQILDFIVTNFSPSKSVPSKTPQYFFINTAVGNVEMTQALAEIDVQLIQLSYRIKPKKE